MRIPSSFDVGPSVGALRLDKRAHCNSQFLNLSAAGVAAETSDSDYGDSEPLMMPICNPWELQFRQLSCFRQEYGHVNVPQHPTEEIQQKYPRLRSFCKNQRSLYKNLLHAATTPLPPLLQNRKERLQSLGFDFDVRQSMWDSKFDELYAFGEERGHFNVKKWERPDLYNWMAHQRQRYKSPDKCSPLTAEQIKRLENIGFGWNPKDEEWWISYRALKRHQEQHGNLKTSDSKLRLWKNSLRRACREYVLAVSLEGTTKNVHVSGLTVERLEALREIQFCWLPERHDGALNGETPEDIFDGYQ